MARVSASTIRFDPYRMFRFRVKWEGQYVAGLTRMRALKRAAEMPDSSVPGVNGNSPELPAKTPYQAVTLESGITYDTTFKDWADSVNDFASHGIVNLGGFRENMTVDVFDEDGRMATSYQLYRCWVTEYRSMPASGVDARGVAITKIKLECESFERRNALCEALQPVAIG